MIIAGPALVSRLTFWRHLYLASRHSISPAPSSRLAEECKYLVPSPPTLIDGALPGLSSPGSQSPAQAGLPLRGPSTVGFEATKSHVWAAHLRNLMTKCCNPPSSSSSTQRCTYPGAAISARGRRDARSGAHLHFREPACLRTPCFSLDNG